MPSRTIRPRELVEYKKRAAIHLSMNGPRLNLDTLKPDYVYPLERLCDQLDCAPPSPDPETDVILGYGDHKLITSFFNGARASCDLLPKEEFYRFSKTFNGRREIDLFITYPYEDTLWNDSGAIPYKRRRNI